MDNPVTAIKKADHMLSDVIDLLACPHCGAAMHSAENSVACANGHAFDVAKQGYLNMLASGAHKGSADSAEMVDARARFLAAGHYDPIAEAVAAAVRDHAPAAGALVDIGAGPGYYLARALSRYDGRGVALDISKFAARRAAKVHPAVGSVVADAWGRLPLLDGMAAAILDVFSPRNPVEFRRILAPGGVVVVVIPNPEHLSELVQGLGLLGMEEDKSNRLDEKMAPLFERVETVVVERPLSMTAEEAVTVVGMGPSSRHTDEEKTRRLLNDIDGPINATLSVTVAVYRAAISPSA